MTVVVAFIIVPKNGGLREYRKKALSKIINIDPSRLIEARGEDIPSLLEEFQSKGKRAIGLTGEDLYREFCAGKDGGALAILERISWDDSRALYRKPALCLLGNSMTKTGGATEGDTEGNAKGNAKRNVEGYTYGNAKGYTQGNSENTSELKAKINSEIDTEINSGAITEGNTEGNTGENSEKQINGNQFWGKGEKTVLICSKYKNLAEQYIKKNYNGALVKPIYANGCIEQSCREGIADFAIDIVYSGETLNRNNLNVLDVIFTSDMLILGQRLIPNPRSPLLGLSPYKAPLESRENALRLDFNENISGCSEKAVNAVRQLTSTELSRYPDPKGFLAKLSSFFGIKKKNLLLANGTDDAIRTIMMAYVSSGDEVIIPEPTFPLFRQYASAAGAKIVSVPYEKDFGFPLKGMTEKISPQAKVVVLVNPNNPTGTAIAEEGIIEILKKARNSLVVVDEAYWEFYGRTAAGLIRDFPNLIVLRTFSKAYGLGGLRIGFIAANENVIRELEKCGTPYSANAAALAAGSAALEDKEYVFEYVVKAREGKKFVLRELQKLGLQAIPSEANFFLVNFGGKAEQVFRSLKERGILVRKISFAGLENYLRVTVGPKEDMEYFIRQLKSILRPKALLFDLDGTIIDVRGSYDAAIQKTVGVFVGAEPKPAEINNLRREGNLNNDWDLCLELISNIAGSEGVSKNITRQEVTRIFQAFLLGSGGEQGLFENEQSLISKSILAGLYEKFTLGIVTGRPRKEALASLKKFSILEYFDIVVAFEDCPQGRQKPDPYGIMLALQNLGADEGFFVGDSVDDIAAANKAGLKSVGVSFCGDDSLPLFLQKKGAAAVVLQPEKLRGVLQ